MSIKAEEKAAATPDSISEILPLPALINNVDQGRRAGLSITSII